MMNKFPYLLACVVSLGAEAALPTWTFALPGFSYRTAGDGSGGGGAGSGSYEGYGKDAAGDTSSNLVHVTNLNNSGAGSFRTAVTGGNNRTVVFDVGGKINLTSTLIVTGHHITVDACSAPSAVSIGGAAISIEGNFSSPSATVGAFQIWKCLRWRDNPPTGDDQLRIAFNAHDIVLDSNSFSGGQDSAVDVTEGAYNVTISNNIFAAESGGGSNDKATLIATGAYRVSYHHNLTVAHLDRNPLIDRDVQAIASNSANLHPMADVRCNIFWDFTIGTMVYSSTGTAKVNVVSNLYDTGVGDHPSNNLTLGRNFGTLSDLYAYRNVSVPDSRGSGFAGGSSSVTITHTNSENRASETIDSWAAVTCPTDQSGRIAAWTSVKNNAGLVAYFSDDTIDANARSRVTIPNTSVLNSAWNDPGQP